MLTRWRSGTGSGLDRQPVPARVQDAIERQQAASERLIGWAQLAIVVTFGILYTVAPKTFVAERTFAPVPWVLAAYLGFTLVRLGQSYRGGLPRWFLALSVVLDMALLFGLIWSFHLQYMQPPAFYLKAPTLLYVFIFIALRALRFDARYVVLAGIVAALGWLTLVSFAVFSDPADDMITRDYVRYMTSASVLLGAEFDKIISILLVTAILAVAITRARQTLIRAVRESAAARDLSRFFAPEVAARITQAEQSIRAGEGDIREAAILNCDIRGFTALAKRLPPSETMKLLADYEARMVAAIQRHGGCVDKFMGDGVMATFGAVLRTATFAADALRAIDALVATADEWAAARRRAGLEPLTIHFAVAVGSVVFGAVGDETRLEYTVIGDAVNLAAKIEKHNKVAGTRALTTADAYAIAVRQGYAAPAPPSHRLHEAVDGVATALDLTVLAR